MIRAIPKPIARAKQRRPLKRKKWIRRKRPRRVAKQSLEDRRYLAWLHRQPCALYGGVLWSCNGPIEAAHFRDVTGVGRKEPDATCIPLCQGHHRDYDQSKGIFLLFERDKRKEWHLARQLETRRAYAESLQEFA